MTRPVREVAALAWPAVVQGLLTTVVFMVDRLMLGRYSAESLASMQVSGPFIWSLMSVFGAFAAGTIAVVGRATGARDVARLETAVAAVLGFALLVGAVVGVLGFATRDAVSELLAGGPATSTAVRLEAGQYMAILFPFTPLFFAGAIATTVLQASGDTRTPLLVALLGEGVNIFGNWVLIYGHLGAPEMGIRGAAIASSTAFALQAVLLLGVLLARRHPARLVLARPGPAHRAALHSVLVVSAPAFGEKLLFHAGFLVFVGLIGRLGDVAMAANQALIAIESLGFIMADGFGVAAGAMVAMKLGAGEPQEAERAGWIATRLGLGALTCVSLLFLAVPGPLVRLFIPDPEVVALAVPCLRIAAIAQPLMAATDALAAGLRGAGDTRTPMAVALVGAVLVRVTATWALAFPLGLGLPGVWIGSTLDWAVRAVWVAVVFKRGRWKRLQV